MSGLRHAASQVKRTVRDRRDERIVRQFAELYHRRCDTTWYDTSWMGTKAAKLPADMWVYQEIFNELRPDLVIETGTLNGGSAYFMATLFDLIGNGRVVSIDIDAGDGRPVHPRIEYITASSTDKSVYDTVMMKVDPSATVMVILDSDHSRDHVLGELALWSPAVSIGSYLVVEDSNVNGHPVLPEHGPGPMEAMEIWLPQHPEFQVDVAREKFMHTFNPGGYLKRVR